MEQILEEYYANNAQKLRGLVDKILSKFGGLSHKDRDDFYSLANEVFVDVMRRYDGSQSFEGFLYSCLSNKIKTEITRRNRKKRKFDRVAISLDALVGNNEDATLSDIIVSDIDIEKQVLEDNMNLMDERVERYFESLSNIQRKIIKRKMQNIEVHHIKQELGLTNKQYAAYMKEATQYEHIRLLQI